MTSSTDLYTQRLARIKRAVAFEKQDRVPVVPLATSFCAHHLGIPISQVAANPELLTDTMIKSFTSLGEIDGVQQPTFSAHILSMAWLSKVKLPGIELPDNVSWQVAEQELMTVADYDTVINQGYNAFFGEFQASRLDNLMPRVMPMLVFAPTAMQLWEKAGIPVIAPIMGIMPYELFCGGRTMPRFMRDMFSMPDKVQAACDAAMPDLLTGLRGAAQMLKPYGAWVGGWRSAPEFLAPKTWNRFVWPYMKKMAELLLEEGVVPIFHLDSNWERELERFLELPKHSCIISPDHATDIFKIKQVLGDHMCIMGDVPAALTALGTPAEVTAYSQKLMNEIGPEGFILSSGCDIPFNAKPENVAAMIAAVQQS
ncbi:MAG: uroD [Holophagaceae bacterium]|nr:uroD [Holophagaceae bacterium]